MVGVGKTVVWKDSHLPPLKIKDLVVDTTGVHSPLHLKITAQPPKVLPFVVFRGTRNISKEV